MCESFDISSSKLYRTFCNCETYIEVKVVSNFLYLKLKKFVNCYVRCCSGGTSHPSERMSQHFFQRTQQHAQRSTHEADTRMVLYAVHGQFRTVVMSSQDTDVLLLLVAHFERAQCEHLWMMSGTSKKRRYSILFYSIHIFIYGATRSKN